MKDLPTSKAGLVILSLAIIVSGCASGEENTSEVTVSQTSGVEITRFAASPSELFGGQKMNLELNLKNKGGQNAQNVKARLYNVPFSGSRSWSISSGNQKVSFDNLGAPDPDADTPSLTVPKTWTLTAPTLQSGVTIPYDFFVRVFYKYETTGTTNIQVMSDERFRESGAGRSKPTLDNSGGPIQMEVRTRTPIVFFSSSGSDSTETSEFCVIVKNVGGGTPFHPTEGVNNGNYAVNDNNLDEVVLKVQSSGSTVSFESTEKKVDLIGGRGVACYTMKANFVSSQDIQRTIPITMTAEYGYYKDSQTSVTVKGR